MDVATLDIRLAVPDDAVALAGTTRLGFESYRAWAPEGWRPPPRSLELRSIRERLRADTTWCAMALDHDGEPAGHVGITHAAERERAHVRIPGRAHLWMLFVRPPWWGSGLAARLHRLGLEEAARQGYETIRLYTPHGAARARAFYEREGWEPAGPAFPEPLLGLDLVEYPARPVIPERLFEEAAERSRVSMRTRWQRVRAGWRTMVQAALAVAASWAVAKWLWGHPAPFFAPVSAIIALGQSYHERGRRAAELVGAVTLGVMVADLLAYELGTGVPQLSLAVFIAVGLGMFFGTSQLFVNQVAISAALVFTITPPSGSVSFARTLDALTGGLIALAVAAIVVPVDPLRILRDAARPVLDELAETLEDIASALRTRDGVAAEAALVRARGIDEFGERFSDATRESLSATRISPTRRRARNTVEFYAEAAARIDLAVRNVRVLARGAMRALALDENVPAEVADALDDLAQAVRALGGALESGTGFDAVRDPALRAAAAATRVLEGTTNLSVSVIVGQVRSTATDLLTGIGLTYEEATDAVRGAAAA